MIQIRGTDHSVLTFPINSRQVACGQFAKGGYLFGFPGVIVAQLAGHEFSHTRCHLSGSFYVKGEGMQAAGEYILHSIGILVPRRVNNVGLLPRKIGVQRLSFDGDVFGW